MGNYMGIGDFDNQPDVMKRLGPLFKIFETLKTQSEILDYGCQIGQITLNLAHKFPIHNYLGVDIADMHIEHARQFAENMGIWNVKYERHNRPSEIGKEFDLVFATEVMEHIADFRSFLIELEQKVNIGGLIFLSTPYGPFEAKTFYKIDVGKRQHIHNFEYDDIMDLVGHKTDLGVFYIHNHATPFGENNGNYYWWWKVTEHNNIGVIDYQRKELIQNPNFVHEERKETFLKHIAS